MSASASGPGERAGEPAEDRSVLSVPLLVGEFVVLLAFWLLLSWRLNPLALGMGVASAALVTATTHDLVARSLGPPAGGLGMAPLRAWRFLGFVGWLLPRIPWAGLQIAYFVLHPRMPVEPALLRFDTHLESQVARTMLANTITLVPGTLTIGAEEGRFTVHAFRPGFADDLVSGELQNRIGRVFLQEPAAPPDVAWEGRADASSEVSS